MAGGSAYAGGSVCLAAERLSRGLSVAVVADTRRRERHEAARAYLRLRKGRAAAGRSDHGSLGNGRLGGSLGPRTCPRRPPRGRRRGASGSRLGRRWGEGVVNHDVEAEAPEPAGGGAPPPRRQTGPG